MRTRLSGERRNYETLFLVGAISQYIGASIAVGLFDDLSVEAVAFLRVLGAAIIVATLRRSWRANLDRSQVLWAVAFGLVLAGMNLAFYLAIDTLPLGTAVAIEFIGPVSVAAIAVRGWRNATALAIAVVGVVLLAEVQPTGSGKGVAFALAAAALWAGYIVLGHRLALSGRGLDGLGIGMLAGAAMLAVPAAPDLGAAFLSPWLLLVGLATGLFSNAIPYAIDQVVMRRVDRSRFAFLQALLPVVAVVVGLVLLGQRLSAAEVVGVALVIVALTVQRSTAPEAITPC